MPGRPSLDPDRHIFERLAAQTVSSMPARFRAQLADVVMQVAEFATGEQLASVGLKHKWELSGLYEGIPLTRKSVWNPSEMPPRIWLFRQPLLAEWRSTGVGLADLVRHVVVHEAGHHFGFSDEEMHLLEDGQD